MNNDDWDAVSSPAEDIGATDFKDAVRYRQRPPVKRRSISGSSIAIIVLSVAVIGLLVLTGLNIFHVVNFNAGNSTITAQATNLAIFSVSQFLPSQNQEITISGKGFGEQAPFTDTTTSYLRIEDVTGNWVAGWTGVGVTVSVSVWSDSRIVITGFGGLYGTNGWVFYAGDKVIISVWNAQSDAGGALFYLVVVS